MMHQGDSDFDLTGLCERAGVTPRTVRYYIQRGLLPAPGAGRGAKYNQAYVGRLQLIRRWQRQHLPLAEIRQRLESMTVGQVADTLSLGRGRVVADSAKDYIAAVLAPSSTFPVAVLPSGEIHKATEPAPDGFPLDRAEWERLKLADDVELHLRRPMSRDMNRRIERLLEVARRILHEN